VPRTGGCRHSWEEKQYSYLPSKEGWERIEYQKTCSKCFEERYHHWVQFEKQEGYQPLARKFKSEPVGWKKITRVYGEGEGA